jgi:phasin
MTELTETTFKTKSKISPAAFEVPKFEVPNFELPKIEIPRAFRELVEKSVSQVKETCDNLKCAADEASDLLEKTYATTTKGTSDYGLKVIEVTRENTTAALAFASQLVTVKSVSEMIELTTAHTRKQYEVLTGQSKELMAIAQKVAADSMEPVRDRFGKALRKSA